jgi:hypothetical protein
MSRFVLGCEAKGHSVDDTAAQGWCSTCRAPPTETHRVIEESRVSGRGKEDEHGRTPMYIPGCDDKGHCIDDTSYFMHCSECRGPATFGRYVYPPKKIRA